MTVVLVCDFNCVKMTVLAHCQGRPFCKKMGPIENLAVLSPRHRGHHEDRDNGGLDSFEGFAYPDTQ